MNTSNVIKVAFVFFIVGIMCGCLLGSLYGRMASREGVIVSTDTVTVYDTLLVENPKARDSVVVKCITKTLPKSRVDNIPQIGNMQGDNIPQIGNIQGDNIPRFAEVADSVEVEIPIIQKRYDGENYSAWVSGYEPRLDSIRVRERTNLVTIRESKPPNRWHVGVQCGVGYAPRNNRIEPYIGIGITYSIISF